MSGPRLPPGRPAGSRAAVTLLEILVALAVLAALAAAGFPAWRAIDGRARVSATRSLIHTVIAAIAIYPQKSWTVLHDHDGDDPDGDGWAGAVQATPPQRRIGRMWDLDDRGPGAELAGDGLLDGRPAAAAAADRDGPFWPPLLTSGYRGFAALTQAPLPRSSLDARGRVIDRWGRPLRIAWSAEAYGAGGVGVWSAGRDGSDGTDDDIRSWTDGQR